MIREYKPSDREAAVSLFQRSMREVANRDYSPAEVSAPASEPPHWEAPAWRVETGGVFVYQRDHWLVGFARIDNTGYLGHMVRSGFLEGVIKFISVPLQILGLIMFLAAGFGRP